MNTLSDQSRYLSYHRDMLKYFQVNIDIVIVSWGPTYNGWQHGGMPPNNTRWIIKTPDHLPRIKELLEIYPDAMIIWTHRSKLNIGLDYLLWNYFQETRKISLLVLQVWWVRSFLCVLLNNDVSFFTIKDGILCWVSNLNRFLPSKFNM